MYNVLMGFGLREILYIAIVFGLFLFSILDLVKRDFTDKSIKIIWALAIIFIPVLGSIFYLLIGRRSGKIRSY